MALSGNQKLYLGCVAVIAVLCIATLATVSGDFGGSDDAGGQTAEDHGYTPWTEDLFALIGFELPGETESLLFAVQAAIGAIIIGYFIGYTNAQRKLKSSSKKEEDKK